MGPASKMGRRASDAKRGPVAGSPPMRSGVQGQRAPEVIAVWPFRLRWYDSSEATGSIGRWLAVGLMSTCMRSIIALSKLFQSTPDWRQHHNPSSAATALSRARALIAGNRSAFFLFLFSG